MSKKSLFFILAIALMSLSINACSLMGTNKVGDNPPQNRINAVRPNKHTKEDVLRLLGSPSSVTLFELESWLYIESEEQNRVFLPAKEINRQVLQVTFDASGVVKSIRTLSLKDGQKIAFDKKTTPVAGKDLSAIDELIGNFGRFPSNKKGNR